MADEQSTPQPPDAGPPPEPMTREQAIDLLMTGPTAWNEWREGNANEEIPILEDAHFEGAKLAAAHLEGAKLFRAHFEGAYL
ncbi:MAG: pentapeptide repeat-containing protein [Planctomycetes bacterium]|nr:pentapeptide repeat-containing protein [Planctomycetota bacterium]